ncbi:MAG: IS1634 family transposase [Candidatus Nanopelagicales bacterium]
MYVRTTPGKPRKDGSKVEYVQLAHNVWDRGKGRSQVQVIHTFGRSDQLDVEGMRRLAGSVLRYLDGSAINAAAATNVGGDLRLLESRPMGAAWLLDQLWSRLGFPAAIGKAIEGRRLAPGVERVLFALVANRAIAPCSKLAALEWAAHDVHLPGIDGLGADPQVLYRAMDVLAEHDTAIAEQVFFAVAGHLGLSCDVLLFDTTSTYFETESDDEFRKYGNPEDHRPDRPQAVIGLAVTKEGIPVRVWSWPGNAADSTVIKQVHRDLGGWGLHRVLWVGDRGFTSAENREMLQRGGGHVLFGEKLRGVTANAQALARPGRFAVIADNIHVKEIWVGTGAGRRRFILVKNPLEAERDARTRTRHLTRIATELAAITRKTGDARLAAEGALLAHPTLKRYLVRRAGNLTISKATVRAEEKLDGKFLLSCTDDNVTAADAARLFKGLLDVERGFRDLKQVLEVRPVYHRKEERIRAHVTLCFLALVLIRVAENATGDTWPAIAREMDRIHLIDLEGSAGRIRQRTEITDTQADILTACQAAAPPLILAAEPVRTPRRSPRKTA